MVFILSDSTDETTNLVIDWINYLGHSFIRHNRRDQLFIVEVNLKKDCLNISLGILDGQFVREIDLNIIESYWYRRGDFVLGIPKQKRYAKKINPILKEEWIQVKSYLHYLLNNKLALGTFDSEHRHNKIITLHIAQELGLLIPSTIITSKKSYIEEDKIITKSIGNMFMIDLNNVIQSIATKRASIENLEINGDWFFPTLFQNEVKKELEIRTFFINGEFYSMAIFSQLDEKTHLDYRNYNKEKPNRMVPYLLPIDIQIKLNHLMLKIGINTGSIDIILTPKGEHVFLEVNPIGQFGWLSYNCNYFLEKKIANFLTFKL